MAVALFNRVSDATRMTLRLDGIGWHGPAIARNLWTHQSAGRISENYSIIVPAHGVVMLRLEHPPQ